MPEASKVIPRAGVTPESVKRWMPDVKGATISMDDQRHMRFVVKYPVDTPPFSFSRSWNTTQGDKRAALIP